MAVIARARVVYNFIAEDSSQISLRAGQMVSIFDKDESGWWDGMNEDTGERGLFPSTYIEEIWDYQAPMPDYLQEHMTQTMWGAGGAAEMPVPFGAGMDQYAGGMGMPLLHDMHHGMMDPAIMHGHGMEHGMHPGMQMEHGMHPGMQMEHGMHVESHAGHDHKADRMGKEEKKEMKEGKGEKDGKGEKKEGKNGKMDDKKEEEMYRNTVTRWGLYGRNMVILNSFGLFGAGIFSIAVWSEGRAVGIRISPLFLGVFILAIVVGLLSMIVELLSQGTTPAQSRAKAVAYTFLALPFLITFFTIFHSVLYLIAVVCFIRSIMLNEYVKPPPKAKAEASKMEMKCESPCYQISKSRGWGLFVFRVLFVGGNVATIVVTYLDWYGRVNRRRVPVLTTAQSVFDSMFPFTFYLPTARVGGSGMNIAYSLILLPVSRTFLRQLYDFSTQNQGIIAKFVRSILWIFPLDKALHFHEKIAYLGLFYAFVHSFAHLVNASLAWDQVVIFYGWSPLISGFVLWVLIYLLYPATPRNTKSGHFELFWYSHQVLWVFFALCIIHGRDTIGPNYWRYIIVPGSIYVLERLYRLFSAYQTVPLISVTNMQNKVLSIEFDKCVFPGGYKEGQYLFLQCPAVSRGQWHPFTISSAPDDPTVTLHIKVGGPKTWTRQVLDYLVLYGPKNASYFELAETSPGGVKLGKTIGPKGERILRVYGPHAAPTEHCPEYQVDIIVGSGIGVTPVSSTMQEILYHRWRFNVGYSFPDHAYFCWVCAHAEIESFRWMIRIVKEAQDQMNELRLKNEYLINGKTFEVHIWVTSKPDDYTLKSYKIEDEDGFWGRRRHRDFNVEKLPSVFEEVDLMNLMLDPPKGPPTILGDIRVYNGRPKWDTIFEQVARRHPGISCGVCFCGNPRIADDLGHMCVKHTVPEKRQIFVLHKENF